MVTRGNSEGLCIPLHATPQWDSTCHTHTGSHYYNRVESIVPSRQNQIFLTFNPHPPHMIPPRIHTGYIISYPIVRTNVMMCHATHARVMDRL